MAEAFLETTVWEDGSTNINHTYYLEGDKMVAYIRYGHSEPYFFKNPITIDRRGRKFQKVASTLFEQGIFIPEVDDQLVEVKGNKGAVYYVNKAANTCTCPGFTYRGACKHITQALEAA
jgi:hypothetical protein